jgi:hypothetical protein
MVKKLPRRVKKATPVPIVKPNQVRGFHPALSSKIRDS